MSPLYGYAVRRSRMVGQWLGSAFHSIESQQFER